MANNENPIVTITDMKSKGKKYEITYKGQTISRTTKKDYHFVVIARGYTGVLTDRGYSSRYDLAKKNYDEWIGNKNLTDVQIVELV
jgi:hypothetical protein